MDPQRLHGPTLPGSLRFLRTEGPEAFSAWVQQCLESVPAKDAEGWSRRLEQGSPDLEATLLEMLALDLSRKAGAQLVEFHPDLGERAKGKRPDFMLRKGTQDLVLEAKWLQMEDEASWAAWKASYRLLLGLQRAVGPQPWQVQMTVYRHSLKPVAFKGVKQALQAGLATATEGTCLRLFGLLPDWDFELRFRKAEAETAAWIPFLRLVPEQPPALDLAGRMVHAVRNKLKRYGRPHVPLVLVLGLDENWDPGDPELETALFGSEVLEVPVGGGQREVGLRRAENGLFGHPLKPTHTRLSGLLVVGRLSAYRLAQGFQNADEGPWATWIPNPHASHPVADLFIDFPTWQVSVQGAAYGVRKLEGALVAQRLLSR